jgi:murein DD-endopeptidase MepM/ murein hydrolase activator NlpD
MIARGARLGVLSGLLCLGSCATLEQHDWYNKAHDATVKGADVAKAQTAKALAVAADRTQKALQRMQHYLAEKDLLKTFHDAGDQSETAINDFLHKAGVGGKSGAAPPPIKAGVPPVAVGPGAGASKSPPTPAARLPEHYAGDMQWPLEAGIVSSEYGKRWGKMHKGIDIAADVGEPVYAVADGDVIYADDKMRGYGNVVILRHDLQRVSLYAHNSELKVKVGDHVTTGTLVALLGNTGHSTGPHVHFEIRDGDNPIDPRSALPPSKLADAVGPLGLGAIADGPATVARLVGPFGRMPD